MSVQLMGHLFNWGTYCSLSLMAWLSWSSLSYSITRHPCDSSVHIQFVLLWGQTSNKSIGYACLHLAHPVSSHCCHSHISFLPWSPSDSLCNPLYLVWHFLLSLIQSNIDFLSGMCWLEAGEICMSSTIRLGLLPQSHLYLVQVSLSFWVGLFPELSIPLVALMVQGFFSWRIWVLAQGNKVFLPILALIGIVRHLCPLPSTLLWYLMQTSFRACAAAWYAGIASSSMCNIAKASLLDPEVTVGSVLQSNTKISVLIFSCVRDGSLAVWQLIQWSPSPWSGR
jgi:hypothetical protein